MRAKSFANKASERMLDINEHSLLKGRTITPVSFCRRLQPVTLLGVVCYLASLNAVYGQTSAVSVEKALFTDVVNRTSKQYGSKFIDARRTDVFKAPTVFLWTRLVGNEDAFEQLKKDKKLPITHKWTYEGDLDPNDVASQTEQETLDESNRVSTKTIQVGTIQGLMALESDLRSHGHFNWRTWSHRYTPASGRYKIEVFYADGTRVDNGSFMLRYVRTRN